MSSLRHTPISVRLAVAISVLAGLAPATASAARPLRTAVVDADAFYDLASIPEASRLVASTGARAVRFYVDWSATAPTSRPDDFDPADPSDPAYYWERLDTQVREATARGLSPILSISRAPDWASKRGKGEPGSWRPDPRAFGKFALAVARRYRGSFGDLPHVRYYQAWNEPNYWRHLVPQYDTPFSEPVREDSKLVSPTIYRRLVNAMAKSVHQVRRDNRVVAGGLSPFGGELAGRHKARVMPFMRAFLCMNERNRPAKNCKARPRFDIWSHHPYTTGGPTHKNVTSLDVSLGDLPRMRKLLRAAIRADHVISRHKVEFWGTEFSWDTDPPDPNAVPMELHKRWVSHALYQMWKSGMSLVTWFQIQDHPGVTGDGHSFESGLYFGCDGGISCATPKPSMQAFRFPFVAFRAPSRVRVWGRTPDSLGGPVLIEQKRGDDWRKVVTLTANRHGIFRRKVRAKRRGGPMRASVTRDTGIEHSLPFSLKRVPDRTVQPFG